MAGSVGSKASMGRSEEWVIAAPTRKPLQSCSEASGKTPHPGGCDECADPSHRCADPALSEARSSRNAGRRITYFSAVASDCSFATRLVPSA